MLHLNGNMERGQTFGVGFIGAVSSLQEHFYDVDIAVLDGKM
jgi:hypothetical protein